MIIVSKTQKEEKVSDIPCGAVFRMINDSTPSDRYVRLAVGSGLCYEKTAAVVAAASLTTGCTYVLDIDMTIIRTPGAFVED